MILSRTRTIDSWKPGDPIPRDANGRPTDHTPPEQHRPGTAGKHYHGLATRAQIKYLADLIVKHPRHPAAVRAASLIADRAAHPIRKRTAARLIEQLCA